MDDEATATHRTGKVGSDSHQGPIPRASLRVLNNKYSVICVVALCSVK